MMKEKKARLAKERGERRQEINPSALFTWLIKRGIDLFAWRLGLAAQYAALAGSSAIKWLSRKGWPFVL
jgi:hypothetical protein